MSTVNITLLLHGGSGRLHPAGTSFPQEADYERTLDTAAQTGLAVQARGGPCLLAVEASLHLMEDSPLFKAGRGAVFSHAGVNEMDVALMDGATLRACAVASVRTVRNPITAARTVLERSAHVLLAGTGTDEFAIENGPGNGPFRRGSGPRNAGSSDRRCKPPPPTPNTAPWALWPSTRPDTWRRAPPPAAG